MPAFVQIPPQSTGKRLATESRKEIYFDNLTGTLPKGFTLTGATSGASGVITSVITEGFGTGAGEIYLKDFTGTFVDNEDLQVSGQTVATVDLASQDAPQQIEFEMQKIVISDPENPEFNQRIDRFGATVNTFTDGSPIFGPFGTLTTGEPQVVKFYRFAMDNVDVLWNTVTAGAGATSWDSTTTTSKLDVGTASGDFVSRTTNYRHPYIPAVGLNIEWSAQFGDSGKTGLRRRMGYFNDNDGIYFEENDGEFFIVLRSSSSGSVVEERIHQADWNRDRADGSDTIGFNLDPTKGNIYWIDMQWLGAGRVRFGVVEPEGERLVLHEFDNANKNAVFPYMKTATLPIRMEQENTGLTISASEMRIACAAVRHTSSSVVNGDQFSHVTPSTTITNTDGEIPILTTRPLTSFNGTPNTGIFKGLSVDFASTTSDSVKVIWRLRFDPTGVAINDGSWADVVTGTSFMEINESATTFIAPATLALNSFIACPNECRNVKFDDDRQLHTYESQVAADGTTQPNIIMTAQVVGTGSADVMLAVNWEEFKV